MSRAFDEAMGTAIGTLDLRWRDKDGIQIGTSLTDLTAAERDGVLSLVRRAIIAGLHGLLHGASTDTDLVRLTFEGHDLAD
jgi:hypothetical protein